MLKAADFIEIRSIRQEQELARRELLYAQMKTLPLLAKQELVNEFLTIIINSNNRISSRIVSCSVLGGWSHEFNIQGSKQITQTLLSLLRKEFLISRNSLFSVSINKSRLRDLDRFNFCLFEAILATLLHIDHIKAAQLIAGIIENTADSDKKVKMRRLLNKIKSTN